jgi:hypothetical protein
MEVKFEHFMFGITLVIQILISYVFQIRRVDNLTKDVEFLKKELDDMKSNKRAIMVLEKNVAILNESLNNKFDFLEEILVKIENKIERNG